MKTCINVVAPKLDCTSNIFHPETNERVKMCKAEDFKPELGEFIQDYWIDGLKYCLFR